jgi:iron complex transport system substrate-binding protein
MGGAIMKPTGYATVRSQGALALLASASAHNMTQTRRTWRTALHHTLAPAALMAWLLTALSTPAHAADTRVSVQDDSGANVTLAAPARRVISLAPHLTELVYAAGGGAVLVGAVNYSDYPPEALQLPRVGDNRALDLERIAALKPDLILVWRHGNAQRQLDALRALGIPLFYNTPSSLDDVAVSLQKLGVLLGTQPQAQAAAAAYRERIAALRLRYRQQSTVRVFYQVWDHPLMTLNDHHWISDTLRLCGARNVFGTLEAGVPTVSTEAVLAADPQAIVTASAGATRPEQPLPGLQRWQQWPQLSAVRAGNLLTIDGDLIDRPTPRLADGAAQLCMALAGARARLGQTAATSPAP